MPRDLYRWEDGGALIHHCPVCHVPLSHEKARSTCLGKHVEWCSLYHTQLFKMGNSRECMACIKSEKESLKRHRDIAEMVREFKSGGGEENVEPGGKGKRGWVAPDKSLTKEERKELKKKAKRAGMIRVVTAADVEAVTTALHGEAEEEEDEEAERKLLDDPEIQLNLYWHRGTQNTKRDRYDFVVKVREAEWAAEQQSQVENIEELDGLMMKLGLPIGEKRVRGGQGRKVLGQIREAVREDMVVAMNEQRDAMMRKAGFWRWASRKAYLRLVANGRCWDDKESMATERKDSVVKMSDSEGDGGSSESGMEISEPATPPPKNKKKQEETTTTDKKELTLTLVKNGGLRRLSVKVENKLLDQFQNERADGDGVHAEGEYLHQDQESEVDVYEY